MTDRTTDPDLVVCDLRCRICGHVGTWALPGSAPAGPTLASLECQRCGRKAMTLAPPPPDEGPEAPPHPASP